MIPTTVIPAAPAAPARASAVTVSSTDASGRARRRAITVTTAIALACAGLLVDLLLVGHTSGDEIWGPLTAFSGLVVATLSLVYLRRRARGNVARFALYALWGMVAFFGFGGFNSHRLPVPADVVDTRSRPPLAPLVFTGLGIAGAVVLRNGAKEH